MTTLSWACQHLQDGQLKRLVGQLTEEDRHYAKSMVLSSNQLTTLPPLHGFRKLESLSLGFNKLMAFPTSVVTRTTLTLLNMSCNALESLPDDIGSLVNLQTLVLRENALESVPKTIGSLPKLLTLDLVKNKLTVMPNELCRLKSLLRLDLEDNRLRMLPYDFDRMTQLNVLRLRGNPLPNYCGENVSNNVAVCALIQRFVAPIACFKASYTFLAIWTFRKEACPELGRLPRDLIKLLVRLVVETRHSPIWLRASEK